MGGSDSAARTSANRIRPISATYGSNGVFDYSFLEAFNSVYWDMIDGKIKWTVDNNEYLTPMVLEEDPRYAMGWGNFYMQASWGNGDALGNWHDFGRKGGYTATDGSNVVFYAKYTTSSNGMMKSTNITMMFEGVSKVLQGQGSLAPTADTTYR